MHHLTLPNSFQFSVTSIEILSVESPELLRASHALWRRVWEEARVHEMAVFQPLNDEDFFSHELLGVLTCSGNIVALLTLDNLDLRTCGKDKHKLLEVWPRDAIDEVAEDSQRTLLCTNMTLDFPYRRNALGFSVKDLVIMCMTHYGWYGLGANVIAAVRREKNMHLSAYRNGAKCVRPNLAYSIPGQFVDLVLWSIPNSESRQAEYRDLVFSEENYATEL